MPRADRYICQGTHRPVRFGPDMPCENAVVYDGPCRTNMQCNETTRFDHVCGGFELINPTHEVLQCRRCYRLVKVVDGEATHVKGTGDGIDSEYYQCDCGNADHQSGFEPCDKFGIPMSPDVGSSWDGHAVCCDCGAITQVSDDGNYTIRLVKTGDPDNWPPMEHTFLLLDADGRLNQCTGAELIAANNSDGFFYDIAGMDIGEIRQLGGGAAASARIKRVG